MVVSNGHDIRHSATIYKPQTYTQYHKQKRERQREETCRTMLYFLWWFFIHLLIGSLWTRIGWWFLWSFKEMNAMRFVSVSVHPNGSILFGFRQPNRSDGIRWPTSWRTELFRLQWCQVDQCWIALLRTHDILVTSNTRLEEVILELFLETWLASDMKRRLSSSRIVWSNATTVLRLDRLTNLHILRNYFRG